MTRDQAFQIILAALPQNSGGHFTASHIATALDALQLLIYAGDNAAAKQRNQHIGSLQPPPVATSNTGEHAAITQQDQPTEPPTAQPAHHALNAWASTRQRT